MTKSNNAAERVIINASVLVIDDSGCMRALVTSMLRDMGFTNILVAIDGAKAWKMLKSNAVDFVICDWDMPGLTGVELLSKMKAYPEYEDIPFLMVTGSNEPKRVEEAIQKGVNGYIIKPFHMKDFSYRVVKLLRKIKTKN